MSEFNELINDIQEEVREGLHTALIGRVARVGNNTADVKPLQGAFPLLTGLPIIKHRYEYTDTLDTDSGSGPTETREVEGPIYQVGDTVLVVFLERPRDGKGQRKHSLEDGIVVGRLA